MNHKKKTIERLRNLPEVRLSLVNLPEQIASLEHQLVALRAARTDGDPVSGGTNHREDQIIDIISEIDECKADLAKAKAEEQQISRSMAMLTRNERMAMERFYINDEKYAAERLCEDLGYERSQVYNIKTKGLERLARCLYGHVEV